MIANVNGRSLVSWCKPPHSKNVPSYTGEEMQGVRRERERENGWLDVLPTEGTGCTMVVPR